MPGATILFCDITRFSQEGDAAQERLIQSLHGTVLHEIHPRLFSPTDLGNTILLPTGDGLAVALLDGSYEKLAPTVFGLIKRLKEWESTHRASLRMGVHIGDVTRIMDVNRRPGICGSTINRCQRVMDAANPGQVLFSDEAFEKLVGRARRDYKPAAFKSPLRFDGPAAITAKHGVQLPVYICYCEHHGSWSLEPPGPVGDIIGRLKRTEYIVKFLRGAAKSRRREVLHVYEQSLFSTFGIPGRDVLEHYERGGAGGDSPRQYVELVLEQRELLERLVRDRRVRLRLIIHPMKVSNVLQYRHRFDSLLEWMNRVKSLKNVDFVDANYEGANRFIVKGQFRMDGYKLPSGHHGYDLNVVYTAPEKIEEAITGFELVFKQARREGQRKDDVIASVRESRERFQIRGVPEAPNRAVASQRGDSPPSFGSVGYAGPT